MGMTSEIAIDHLPDHILLSGLELMEGLFSPFPTDSLGTVFSAAHLTSPVAAGFALVGCLPVSLSAASQGPTLWLSPHWGVLASKGVHLSWVWGALVLLAPRGVYLSWVWGALVLLVVCLLHASDWRCPFWDDYLLPWRLPSSPPLCTPINPSTLILGGSCTTALLPQWHLLAQQGLLRVVPVFLHAPPFLGLFA
jgi:hypothetical protein